MANLGALGALPATDPLMSAASAIARLRGVLPLACDATDDRRRELVELAVADVIRALVLARRSMRALLVQTAELDEQGRDLIALAARALAMSADSIAEGR